MKVKLYRCRICGQIVGIIQNTSVPLICCGREMEELIPASIDASQEKHVPKISVDGSMVTVMIGCEPHPMTSEHHITWVFLETTHGIQFRRLAPESEPRVCFRICSDEKVTAACAFCNLHGLWQAEMT